MISQLERVASRSTAPILLFGPTGAGKSQLARQLFALKKQRSLVEGELVSVNCATLRGDSAMSTLFGHIKGAYTGAQHAREGLLARAHQGVLFLDEIGELGLDEQATLLHAIEERCFYPVGSDKTVSSDFQLIAGTNKDLFQQVEAGHFREDLLARINLWTYTLPGLAERPEDIEPNIEYELQALEQQHNHRVAFNQSARKRYLDFACSADASWRGNFRDLNASIQRMATLAEGGRITLEDVEEEIAMLKERWREGDKRRDGTATKGIDLNRYLSEEQLDTIDLFDRLQLQQILPICIKSRNLSEAGRKLFDQSRLKKSSSNDSHRIRQYLAKFGLDLSSLQPLE